MADELPFIVDTKGINISESLFLYDEYRSLWSFFK